MSTRPNECGYCGKDHPSNRKCPRVRLPFDAPLPGKIDHFEGPYAFLSNFHPSPITFGGLTYPTVEHAYQAAKTLDNTARARIAALPYAAAAKKAGRLLVIREEWDTLGDSGRPFKVEVMAELLALKFTDPDLRNALLKTAPLQLVEGNWWRDRFWGEFEGKGENWLGRLLMELRDGLQEEKRS